MKKITAALLSALILLCGCSRQTGADVQSYQTFASEFMALTLTIFIVRAY